MGAENLYGRYFLPRIPGFMSAKFHGIGTGKGQSAARPVSYTHLLFIDRTIVLNSFQQIVCTNVGSHDQDCILEVNCTSLGI